MISSASSLRLLVLLQNTVFGVSRVLREKVYPTQPEHQTPFATQQSYTKIDSPLVGVTWDHKGDTSSKQIQPHLKYRQACLAYDAYSQVSLLLTLVLSHIRHPSLQSSHTHRAANRRHTPRMTHTTQMSSCTEIIDNQQLQHTGSSWSGN